MLVSYAIYNYHPVLFMTLVTLRGYTYLLLQLNTHPSVLVVGRKRQISTLALFPQWRFRLDCQNLQSTNKLTLNARAWLESSGWLRRSILTFP